MSAQEEPEQLLGELIPNSWRGGEGWRGQENSLRNRKKAATSGIATSFSVVLMTDSQIPSTAKNTKLEVILRGTYSKREPSAVQTISRFKRRAKDVVQW